MNKHLAVIGAGILLCCVPCWADDIDDIRDGADLDFDLVAANYTYSGVQSGTGSITDEQSPATCSAKSAGTLNMVIDGSVIFPGTNLSIPLAGTKLSPTQVRWTTDTSPNQTVTVIVNGQSLTLKITRIRGQITGDSTPVNLFRDVVCGQGYNVRLDDTGSNTDTWLDINTLVNGIALFPLNFQVRNIDYIGFGGVARGTILGTNLTIVEGLQFGGGLSSLHESDNQKLILLLDEVAPNGKVELVGESPGNAPSMITIQAETSSSRPDMSQFLRAFNFGTGSWSTLLANTATLADTSYSFDLNAPLGTYIESGTRAMKLQLHWIPQADIEAGDGWTVSTDVMRWGSVP